MTNEYLYNPTEVADRIKVQAKIRPIVIKDMLSEIGLNSNAMSSLRHGKAIGADSLAKIADYLNCSVDYLLGRTDIPTVALSDEPVLKIEEYPILAKYRALSERGKTTVEKLLDETFNNTMLKKNTPTAFSDERIEAVLQEKPELTELAKYIRSLDREQTLQVIGYIQQLLQQQNKN